MGSGITDPGSGITSHGSSFFFFFFFFFEGSGIRLYHFCGIRDHILSLFWNKNEISDTQTSLRPGHTSIPCCYLEAYCDNVAAV